MITLIVFIIILLTNHIYSIWILNAPFDSRLVELCDIHHYSISILGLVSFIATKGPNHNVIHTKRL